jgi:hypothetical protein
MTALLSFMFGIQTAGKFAKFANFRPAKGQQYVWLFINICACTLTYNIPYKICITVNSNYLLHVHIMQV